MTRRKQFRRMTLADYKAHIINEVISGGAFITSMVVLFLILLF